MWGSRSPFNAPDQDALNALLMSEIPREALALLPEDEEVFGGDATVEDFNALTCTSHGRPTKILTCWIARNAGSAQDGSGSLRQTTSGSCVGSCLRTTLPSGSIPATCRCGCDRGWVES
jgi:hypothetical protein